MTNKTEIVCSVRNCLYHKDSHCEAETISVACNNCIMPHDCGETECTSFRNKNVGGM